MTSEEPGLRESCANCAVFVGAIGCGMALLATMPILLIGSGEHIRPMAFAGHVFLIEMFTVAVGLPSGLIGCFSPRHGWAALGMLLSVLPLVIAMSTRHLAAALKGFVLAD